MGGRGCWVALSWLLGVNWAIKKGPGPEALAPVLRPQGSVRREGMADGGNGLSPPEPVFGWKLGVTKQSADFRLGKITSQ